MDREAWWATYSPWGHKGSDTTERQTQTQHSNKKVQTNDNSTA